MTTATLSFSLPHRASRCTGSRTEHRLAWTFHSKKRGTMHESHEVEMRRREVTVDQPMFVSQPWDVDTALRAILAGGWFNGSEEFASKEVKAFAFEAQATFKELRDAS